MKHHQHIADLAKIIKNHEVSQVIICPGSRNAPLIQVFSRDPFFKCYSVVDERSAAYVALGMARELDEPVVLITTSGTATLNLAPAIAEAFYQQVPMVVLTADRPSEWPPQFSNQVISQEEIFVRNSKHFFDITMDIENKKKKYKRMLKEVNFVIADSNKGRKGPVHLNVPMREPLYDLIPESELEEVKLSKDKQDDESSSPPGGNVPRISEALIDQQKVLFIAGSHRYSFEEKRSLQLLTEKFQVTVLADNISNFDFSNLITNPDKLLAAVKDKEQKSLIPDLVVTFGGQVVSRRTKIFVQALEVEKVVVLQEFPKDAFDKLAEAGEESNNNKYLKKWKDIEQRAITKCREFFKDIPFGNVAATRNIIQALPADTVLHLGNSGPIRYSQLLHPRADVLYFGNRGTSGIDGSLSTAVGAAMVSDKLHVFISGDMSFVYDSNGMWNREYPSNLRIIVLNDKGGGIFDIIEGPDRTPFYEKFQKAHHPVSIESLTAGYGLKYLYANDIDSLNIAMEPLFKTEGSRTVLEVDTSKSENSRIFKELFESLKS